MITSTLSPQSVSTVGETHAHAHTLTHAHTHSHMHTHTHMQTHTHSHPSLTHTLRFVVLIAVTWDKPFDIGGMGRVPCLIESRAVRIAPKLVL